MTEDETVGWHYWLNGHKFEQVIGDGEGQGSRACCSPWGHKEWDMTEQLNKDSKDFLFIVYHVLLSKFNWPKEPTNLKKKIVIKNWLVDI